MELSLEGSVGHAASTLQQADNLIENPIEIHPHSLRSMARYLASQRLFGQPSLACDRRRSLLPCCLRKPSRHQLMFKSSCALFLVPFLIEEYGCWWRFSWRFLQDESLLATAVWSLGEALRPV